ncbi:MAG: hypothetical protein EX271_11790 [Acidimicrobiales bacterium]|nr:hypothetical protein [Hyphomonadaceae bacterium]RZV37086.1 MAG: hypothetical protein EX271_11790 [Acidimicrobiales bacterium]
MTVWKKTVVAVSTALLLSGVSTMASASDMDAARQAIEDALPGTLIHNPLDIEWESRGNDKKVKVVDAATPTGQALSARVKKRKQKPWDVVVWFDLEDSVQSGEEVEMHFWARTAKAAKGEETAKFTVFVGEDEEPYDYIISEEFTPGKDWKLHTLKGVAKKDFPGDELKVEYQIGQHVQTIEFGPVYVSNLGSASE